MKKKPTPLQPPTKKLLYELRKPDRCDEQIRIGRNRWNTLGISFRVSKNKNSGIMSALRGEKEICIDAGARAGNQTKTGRGKRCTKHGRSACPPGQRRRLRARRSHVCHHRLTPSTAARPSSFRSVPSGLPRTIAKIQKKAAVQARRRKAMERRDDSRRTAIRPPME